MFSTSVYQINIKKKFIIKEVILKFISQVY
jgi:hypothetical protein